MKAFKSLQSVIILAGILLSACTAAPASQAIANAGNASSAGSDKPLSEVVFTGAIESMDGDQWVINGQTITVDSSSLQEGTFLVGDTVKVEARVAADGSVTAQRVESPTAKDLVETATSTPKPAASEPSVIFDDSGDEVVGVVEAITDTSITLGGQTYSFTPGAEIKGTIGVGAIVKLHLVTNADGTLSVREVEIADPTQIGGDNSNDDNSNDASSNDNSSNDNGDDNSNNNSNDNSNNDSNDDDDDDNDNDNSNSNDDDDDDDDNSNDSNDNG